MPHHGFTHESQHNLSQEWYTPPRVFDALGLTFDLDVASPGAGAVPWIPARLHLTIVDDGLQAPWCGRVWMNPPYGRQTRRWVAHFRAWSDGVALVFARTDTEWFHKYAVECDAWLFIRGRLRFIRGDGKCGKPASAGSMLLANGAACCKALQDSGLGFYCEPTT